MSWDEKTLGDLATFQRGFDITKKEQIPGPFPVISSSGANSTHNKSKVSGPGVVIGRKGSLGTVHYSEGDFWPHDTTLWVKNFHGNDPRFVYYFLQSLSLERFDVGSSNPTLNRNHIHPLQVRFPNVHVQREIVAILSAYDDLIKNNKRRIELLEESARLLYQEWFVHLRFPGHEHVEVVDGVPEGWKKAKVADLGDVVTGKTPSTKDPSNYGGKMPFIKTPDMHDNPVIVEAEKYLTEKGARSQANKTLPAGSVMVTCIGTVGVVSMNAFEAQTNQQINSVIPKPEHLRYYAFFALSDFKARLEALGGGATMSNVNKTKFMSLPVTIPTTSLLIDFDQHCRPIFSQIKSLLIQNRKLKEARDLLLPRLMNGEITV